MALITPKIGALEFSILTGRVMPLSQAGEDVIRPGIDGHETLQVGLRGDLCEIRTVKRCANAAAMKTHENFSAALQNGAALTVTYSDGQTRPNVVVRKVRTESAKLAQVVSGIGSGNYVIRQTWTVQQVAAEV